MITWVAHTGANVNGTTVATQCGAPYVAPPAAGGYQVRVCPDCSADPLPHLQTMAGHLEMVRPKMRQWVRSMTPQQRAEFHESMTGIATASMRDPSTQPPLWSESDLCVAMYVLATVRTGLMDRRQSGARLTYADMTRAIDTFEMAFVALVEGVPQTRSTD